MMRTICIFLLIGSCAVCQDQGSDDSYFGRAQKAIEAENFESAVRIIEEGKERFPGNAELWLLLADLYYEEELYGLALEEYLEAGELEGEQYLILTQVSRCYGKLNREQDAIATLQRILELYPESVTSIDDLGWMYFKTHQLEKGAELLLDTLERFGPDRGVYMTLGTLYSGLYDYENSKRFYLEAIRDAVEGEDPYFASVAYYNLSLLEHSFYNFNSALRYTEESIRMSDRAPGHLARGELFQSRLDFRSALSEYQSAMLRDSTPLTKVNLALLYQQHGMLDLARRYAEDVLGSGDRSWMYYYGTDVERHLEDVHEILADTYVGLARQGAAQPRLGLLENLRWIPRKIAYRLRAYYHRQKFRSYALNVGHSYLQEDNRLDAYWEYYRANERYRRVALKYLWLARDLEVQVSSHAVVYYLQEEGKVRGSRELLEQSIEGFDPFWEREGIAESLCHLVPLLEVGSAERREALNRLYDLNPGALLQRGFALPLSVDPRQRQDRMLRRCIRLIRRSGSRISFSADASDGYLYHLELQPQGDTQVRISLHRGSAGPAVFAETVTLGDVGGRRRAAALARAVLEQIYTVGRR